MSATLSWALSALGTKTGTTGTDFITDLNTLVVSNVSDADYKWEVASYSIAGNPRYLVLKRKDASVGRMLFCFFNAVPGAINPTVSEVAAGSVSTTVIQVAWFPAGNVDTPSNITAASGTILGNDTDAVKFTPATVSAIYPASFQLCYADSSEAIWVVGQNPAASTGVMLGVGKIVVDASDNEYDGIIPIASIASYGANTTNRLNWTAAAPQAGTATAAARINFGGNSRVFYEALGPSGVIFNTAPGTYDLLIDAALSKAYFFPQYLAGVVKSSGIPLKTRQMGFGPLTASARAIYSTTGPVVAARQVNTHTSGGSFPWVTNFKI